MPHHAPDLADERSTKCANILIVPSFGLPAALSLPSKSVSLTFAPSLYVHSPSLPSLPRAPLDTHIFRLRGRETSERARWGIDFPGEASKIMRAA